MLPLTLRRSRELTQTALRQAVAAFDPQSRRAAEYHLGWVESDGSPASSDGGKSLRATLALLSGAAVSAPCEVAVPGAVAVELVHNFSLLHDDVMDRDTHRRHRLTVWCVWGAPTAILAGDAMLTAAQEVLLSSGSPRGPAAALLLLDATRELIRGQQEDLAFERRLDVDVAGCLEMAEGKTGALLAVSACIGAVLADAPSALVEALQVYGEHVGVAFQFTDDLLGIWGDRRVTGKPVLSDLRARKRSLPITYALTRGGRDGEELAAWFVSAAPDTEASLLRAASLVERAGGRAWALEQARARVGAAQAALADAELPAWVGEELVSLAGHVVEREC